MLTSRLLAIAMITIFTVPAIAQTGLWEVVNVSVGDQVMTPVAKWFDINEDGTVMSGNGGIINIRGTYEYDPASVEMIFTGTDDTPDPMGAFKIEFDDSRMTWQRTEEGMNVIVSLVRVTEIPDGPWDMCVGPWLPEDAEAEESLFMSWDRTFRISGKNGAKRGVWHIGAHNPELTLYYQDGTSKLWTISFPDQDRMIWTSDFGDEKVFVRDQANE